MDRGPGRVPRRAALGAHVANAVRVLLAISLTLCVLASCAKRAQTPEPPPANVRLPAFGEEVVVLDLPEVISRAEAIYPVLAEHKGIQGTVVVHALVLPDGRVWETRVVETIPELEHAAVACVKRWRFRPARLDDGRAVAVWVACPVKFTLQ